MKTQTWISLIISLSTAVTLSSPQGLPAVAQILSGDGVEQSHDSSATSPSPTDGGAMVPQAQVASPTAVTIPATTGIIVSFLAPVTIDANETAYPLTLPLAQAITDTQGRVIVPENSPVSVVLQPEAGGARILAQSIVINGQIVPIQASSLVIPGTTITHVRANERAAENGTIFGRIAATGFGFLGGGDPNEFDRGAMLGTFIGMVSGRRDESTRVVNIPQGSVYVLPLEEPVHIGR